MNKSAMPITQTTPNTMSGWMIASRAANLE